MIIMLYLYLLTRCDKRRTLTRLRRWSGCDGLFDGHGLCWPRRKAAHAAPGRIFMNRRRRWKSLFCGVCFQGLSGLVQGHISAAARVAASDCDRFGHVHAKQRAEGLRLRGAHTGHSSGLDTVSTGWWTLKSTWHSVSRLMHKRLFRAEVRNLCNPKSHFCLQSG